MNKSWTRIAIALALSPTVASAEPPTATLTRPAPDTNREFREIPPGFDSVIVNDERDLIDLTPTLTFTGTERLEYLRKEVDATTTRYIFKEWIGDLSTMNFVWIDVDNESFRVTAMQGLMERDPFISHEPRLSEGRARGLAMAYLQGGGKRFYNGVPLKHHGRVEMVKLLNEGEVWWSVGLELGDAHWEGTPPLMDYLWVSPSGVVTQGGKHTVKKISPVEECDGRASPDKRYCSTPPASPLIINRLGQCQPGYTCTKEYTKPYATARNVERMWEAIRGTVNCCNVGDSNRSAGGDLEIKIGGNIPAGAAGGYVADILPDGGTVATMVLDPLTSVNPDITSHEMGHAYHARVNFTNYHYPSTEGSPASSSVEDRAVEEYIGDVNSVMFKNYIGNGQFSTTPRWTTYSKGGGNYDLPYTYTQMNGGYTDYRNARVGGHAFYVLVQKVGFSTAAKVFLHGVEALADTDKNQKTSWMEMREAMIRAAVALALHPSIVAGIKDSWAAVGVGPDSSVLQPPLATPPPGAPASVPWLSLSLYQSCNYPYTGYTLSYGPVTGAVYYDVFHSFGGDYQLTGHVTQNPVYFYTTANALVRMRACNGYGCSSLSAQTWSAPVYCGVSE